MIDADEFAQRLAVLPKDELRALDQALGPTAGRILLKAIPELSPLIEPFLMGSGRQVMDDGGLVTARNRSSDRVPIDAQAGEFVVSRPAVGAFGPRFFEGLNDAALGQSRVSPTQPLGGLPGAGGTGAVSASAVPGAGGSTVPATVDSPSAAPVLPTGLPSGAPPAATTAPVPTLPAQALANASPTAFAGGRPFQGVAPTGGGLLPGQITPTTVGGLPTITPPDRLGSRTALPSTPTIPGLPTQARIPTPRDQALRNAAIQALKFGRPFV